MKPLHLALAIAVLSSGAFAQSNGPTPPGKQKGVNESAKPYAPGQKKQTGEVIVQTSQPAHPVLDFVTAHDYRGFFEEELSKREEFSYPPFSRLILLSFRHSAQPVSIQAARSFASVFSQRYGSYLVGPAPAVIPRVRNQYRTELLVKLPRRASLLSQCKNDILEQIILLNRQQRFRSVQVVVDVDII